MQEFDWSSWFGFRFLFLFLVNDNDHINKQFSLNALKKDSNVLLILRSGRVTLMRKWTKNSCVCGDLSEEKHVSAPLYNAL